MTHQLISFFLVDPFGSERVVRGGARYFFQSPVRESSQDFPKFDVGIPLRRTEKQSGDGDEDADWDAGDVGAAA